MAIDKKNKTIIIVSIIVVLLLIITSIYFYYRGKKTVTIQQVPSDNPNQGNTGNNNPNGLSDSSIEELANRLYNEMNGINMWRDSAPYNDLLLLSDTDFVRVYNTFNTLYQKDSGETLMGWLQGESGIGEFATFKNQILTRMGRLGLI